MIKVISSITLELKSGQKISISVEEGRELIRGLLKFVEPGTKPPKMAGLGARKNEKAGRWQKRRFPGMSEAKKDEILRHVEKNLSSKPRTLSNLLNGISYMPNHLPMIRRLIENQPSISKKTIGKRTFYFAAKDTSSKRMEKPKVTAAAA